MCLVKRSANKDCLTAVARDSNQTTIQVQLGPILGTVDTTEGNRAPDNRFRLARKHSQLILAATFSFCLRRAGASRQQAISIGTGSHNSAFALVRTL